MISQIRYSFKHPFTGVFVIAALINASTAKFSDREIKALDKVWV